MKKVSTKKTNMNRAAPQAAPPRLAPDPVTALEHSAAQIATPTDLAPLQSKSQTISGEVRGLAVRDGASLARGNEMLVMVVSAKKSVEEKRTFFTGPLRTHVKRIDTLFRAVLDPLEIAERELRAKISTYRQAEAEAEARRRREAEEAAAEAERAAEEKRRKAEQARSEKERVRLEKEAAVAEESAEATAHAAAMLAPTAPPKTMVAGSGTVAARKVWTFEVRDAAQIPREYLIVDERKLRAAVRSGLREIPGVRIYEDESLAVTGGRDSGGGF